MKLIKMFFRVSKVDDVVGALRAACAPGITISRVNGVGYGYEPLLFTLSPSEIKKAPEVARVEVVCRDEDVQRLVDKALKAAHTGSQGDGIIFVTNIERAIKIRTGDENGLALEC